jgi:Predicted transcriptional regulator, contains C-terminal CBS domains
MTDRVLTAQADWSLQELASFFTEHSISGAPVISDYGGVIGVVSVTDIARYDSEASSETEEEAEREEPPAFLSGRCRRAGRRGTERPSGGVRRPPSETS